MDLEKLTQQTPLLCLESWNPLDLENMKDFFERGWDYQTYYIIFNHLEKTIYRDKR